MKWGICMKTNEHTNESCHSHNHSEQNHNQIELHKHENALVCSGERDLSGNLEAVKEKMTSEIGILADWVEEQGGITGHIKALVDVIGPGFMLSTTGGEVESKKMSRSNIHVTIVAIVFKVDEKEIKCQIASLIDGL